MDFEYLNNYESSLLRNMMSVASVDTLLETEDLTHLWDRIAPEYMVDAVPNVAKYPLVSIAWAGYVGMAFAHLWDKDVHLLDDVDGLSVYARLRSARGFDEMDEHIVEDVLGFLLSSPTASRIEESMRTLSQVGLDAIRHEAIEPQTEMAFHVYARTVRTMFRIGVSVELARLKYHLTRVK